MQTYLSALQNFKNFCIVNNFDFYLQPVPPKHLLFYNDPQSKHGNIFADIYFDWQYLLTFEKMFQEILDCSVDSDLSLFDCMHAREDTEPMCGFKHPTENAHEYFAEKLYVKITNKKD